MKGFKHHLAWIVFAFIGELQADFFDQFQKDKMAASVALKLELPELVEMYMQPYILSPFPYASEARTLMAWAAFQKNDYTSMLQQKRLAVRDTTYVWMEHVFAWMEQHRLKTSLVYCYQLSDFESPSEEVWYRLVQAAIFYPVQIPKWCGQWQQIISDVGEQKANFLLEIALQMKFYLYGNHELVTGTQTSYLNYLFEQQKFDEMLAILSQRLNDPNVDSKQKSNNYLWLLRIKNALGEDLTPYLLEALQKLPEPPSWLNTILDRWFKSLKPENTRSNLHTLQTFFQKSQPQLFYSLKLMEVEWLIRQQRLPKAEKKLKHLQNLVPENLKKNIYLLWAKLHSSQPNPSYRLIADDLKEAQQCTTNISEQALYTSLRADLYLLDKDYNRAYYVYQSLLTSALANDLKENVAYHWGISGILCNENPEELQQQFDYCNELSLLTPEHRAQLELIYAQHLLDQQDYEGCLHFLGQHMSHFLSPDLFEQFTLLRGKTYLQLDEAQQALQCLQTIHEASLSEDKKMELLLFKGLASAKLGDDKIAKKNLKQALRSQILSTDLVAAVLFEWVQILNQQKKYARAQKFLLDFAQQHADSDSAPFALLQAAQLGEKRGLDYAQATLEIFQKLQDTYPRHPLATHARVGQATLLMNLNQMDAAKSIFANLRAHSTDSTMRAFCELCMVRCLLNESNPELEHCAQCLERLLLEKDLPLSLTLEITLQLAYIYIDRNRWNDAQRLLWGACHPFLQTTQTKHLNNKEIYWLIRCLLTLAQQTRNRQVAQQIYELMHDANLLDEALLKQYLK